MHIQTFQHDPIHECCCEKQLAHVVASHPAVDILEYMPVTGHLPPAVGH